MMKRFIISCMVALAALVIGGCALPRPEFNQTYLPNSVPGSPQKRIDIPKYVTDKASEEKWSLFGKSPTYLPTSLYWIEEDTLLFNILSEDRHKSLHSFLFTNSTGQIKALHDAEKDAILSKIEKNIIADKTGISVGEFIGFALQVTIALAGGGGSSGGSSSGSHFLGKIENNGYVLDIDATVNRKKWFTFSSAYNCYYEIKNRQTGETFKGKAEIEKIGKKQESLEIWLKSWRISPDGRFYLIEKTATFIVPENNDDTAQTLIENYPYAALDISPKWDHIALLLIKEDEKTKQKNYWIEFYPFSYKKINERQIR